MKRQIDISTLLRWYPSSWRERYGDELLKLMADTLDGQRPTMKFRLSIMLAGLRERAHSSGLTGDSAPDAVIVKVGSLMILCAWVAFVFAGMSFAKFTEHFSDALPQQSRTLPIATFHLIELLGIFSGVLVLAGAARTLPTFTNFLRKDEWKLIKGRVVCAMASTIALFAAAIPIGAWAHHLTQYQRNGGDGLYSLAFVAWALLLALVLAAWSRTVVALARRMELSPLVIRLEGLLAQAVAITMLATTAATGMWWTEMAMYAPQYFNGTRPGTSASPFDFNLILIMTLMIIAIIVSGYGAFRVRHFWVKLGNA